MRDLAGYKVKYNKQTIKSFTWLNYIIYIYDYFI